MRKKYIALSLVCLVLCVGCIALFFALRSGWFPGRDLPPTTEEATTTLTQTVSQTTEKSAYKSPIRFKKLQKQNADIYAWLEIPGTTISEPVVQSATDDNYYLRRDLDGNYSIAGTLFTEHTYNSRTFQDPVTIIYGHHMLDDTMFGNLQAYYSDEETFRSYETVTVYLPDRELHYQVFAAVPYSNQHILYHYNGFALPEDMETFLYGVSQIRGFGVNRREDVTIEKADRLLILSTCLQGNRNKRYLVIARLQDVLS